MSREKQNNTPTNTPTQNQFTNSELKQIEEMAKCCPFYKDGKCEGEGDRITDCDLMCKMFGFITNLLTASYRKQSEGEWEKRTFIIFDFEKVGYRCSECNTTWDAPTPCCPNCGAKMKGANDEN